MKSHRKLNFRSSLALVLVALLLQVTPVLAETNSNSGVLPPHSTPYGKTYQEWSNAWWQWALSIPVIEGQEQANPLFDLTGANCGVKQSGQVWFLAGVFLTGGNPMAVTRECRVPAGKALFFPLINYEVDAITPPVLPLPEMRDLLGDILDIETDLSAQVDGQSIQNLQSYNTGSAGPAFCVNLPANNIYQYFGFDYVTPQEYCPLISGGYYLMLAPLSKGIHTIHFTANNQLDITYRLIVGG